ncbi:MAG: hypothetical protein OHK0046_09510 [Anaerolineae bacterium]
MPAPNDPQTVQQIYQNDEDLRTRQDIHAKYTVPSINYVDWVIQNILWRGDEHVLDVGSGSGSYHPALQKLYPNVSYFGFDVSAGMLDNHPAKDRVIQADAQKIPFQDHTFDVIMANHMVYHLQDIEAGLTEFKRLLKPEGLLMVATNSTQSMPELQVLMRRAILLLTRTGSAHIQPPRPASDLFALENGSRRLSRHFYAVVRYDLPSKLVFPEIDPIMQYLESTRAMREPQLPEDVAWDDVMMIMRQQITHLVNHLGELVVNKLSGVLLASDQGGFIQSFIERRNSNHK